MVNCNIHRETDTVTISVTDKYNNIIFNNKVGNNVLCNEVEIKEALIKTESGYDLLATTQDLIVAEMQLLHAPNREQRLKTILATVSDNYDYILIDSPPIGLVTDAKILNKYIDACLYMVRHKYTPKNYLNLIDDLYSNREMNNLNIIFNGIKARGGLGSYGGAYGSNYGYGYGYGYGDGYGYTDEDNKKRTKGKFIKGITKKSK